MNAAPAPAPTKLITPKFRAPYIHIWEPQTDEKTKRNTFSIAAMWDKEQEKELAPLFTMIAQVAEAKFGKGAKGWINPIRPGVDLSVNPRGFDLDKYPFYEGKIIANLKSIDRVPGVVKLTGNPQEPTVRITEKSDLYRGCYCVATISAYAYDNNSKGVNLNLFNLCKVGDGSPLTSQIRAEDDFAEINPADYGIDNSAMFDAASADLLGGI